LETIPVDSSVTFRGHAKGVRYDNPTETREWSEMLYEVCLDDPPFVDESLKHYPITGPFLVESDWPLKGRWHYSGSFYWFRSDVSRKRQIADGYWMAELWPQSLSEKAEAGCLFGQTCARLYDQRELQRMRDWFAAWRRERGQIV
jgi:hypothetical protein